MTYIHYIIGLLVDVIYCYKLICFFLWRFNLIPHSFLLTNRIRLFVKLYLMSLSSRNSSIYINSYFERLKNYLKHEQFISRIDWHDRHSPRLLWLIFTVGWQRFAESFGRIKLQTPAVCIVHALVQTTEIVSNERHGVINAEINPRG